MCNFDASCDLLLNTPPLNDKKNAKHVMSGVTKLTVIFDENNHIIAFFSICAPKRHTLAMTKLIERPTKAEVRRRNVRDTGRSEMSGSV